VSKTSEIRSYNPSKRKDLNMYAIVETGGKQYQVEEGRYVDVELLGEEADAKVVFDKVVMIVNGKKSKVGQPYVEKATVEGTVIKTDRAKKIIVYKQRPKKGYRRKYGHRQGFARVMINKIRTTAAKKAEATETAEA
jgi:large subunit ribosomal protein L21